MEYSPNPASDEEAHSFLQAILGKAQWVQMPHVRMCHCHPNDEYQFKIYYLQFYG